MGIDIKVVDVCACPIANFYLMNYINFQATSNLMNETRAKVVCLDNCAKYVRKYLDDKVEVTCISVDWILFDKMLENIGKFIEKKRFL